MIKYFFLFCIAVFTFLFISPQEANACTGAYKELASSCEQAICSGYPVSGIWQGYVKYSDDPALINGTCTQLEYFPDSTCNVNATRATNPCSGTCSSHSECCNGSDCGTCAGAGSTALTACFGNYGLPPYWCQGFNCGYQCTSSYTCEQIPIGIGLRGGDLAMCQVSCVAPPPPPPEPEPPPHDPGCSYECGSHIEDCGGGQVRQCTYFAAYENTCHDPCKSDCGACEYPASWSGQCTTANNAPAFSVSGTGSGTSHAYYDNNPSTPAWFGENVPFTHYVENNRSFTWYIDGISQPQGTTACSYTPASTPVPTPIPLGSYSISLRGKFVYPDGSNYDGFGLPEGKVPLYNFEYDSDNDYACPWDRYADYITDLDGSTAYSDYVRYGGWTSRRAWSKSGFHYVQFGWQIQTEHYAPGAILRFMWPQFPSDFRLRREFDPTAEGAEGDNIASECCKDTMLPPVKDLPGYHFDYRILCAEGWNPQIIFTVQPPARLTVTKTGNGNGTVKGGETSNLSQVSCGSTCNYTYYRTSATLTNNPLVQLEAIPNVDSRFSGWTGCDIISGTTCTVYMNRARAVTATFDPAFEVSGNVYVKGFGDTSCTASPTLYPGTPAITTLTPLATVSYPSNGRYTVWLPAGDHTITLNPLDPVNSVGYLLSPACPSQITRTVPPSQTDGHFFVWPLNKLVPVFLIAYQTNPSNSHAWEPPDMQQRSPTQVTFTNQTDDPYVPYGNPTYVMSLQNRDSNGTAVTENPSIGAKGTTLVRSYEWAGEYQTHLMATNIAGSATTTKTVAVYPCVPTQPVITYPTDNGFLEPEAAIRWDHSDELFNNICRDARNGGTVTTDMNDRYYVYIAEESNANSVITADPTSSDPNIANGGGTLRTECSNPSMQTCNVDDLYAPNKKMIVKVMAFNGAGDSNNDGVLEGIMVGEERTFGITTSEIVRFTFAVMPWLQFEGGGDVHANDLKATSMSLPISIKMPPVETCNDTSHCEPYLFTDKGVATVSKGSVDISSQYEGYSHLAKGKGVVAASGTYQGPRMDYNYWRAKVDSSSLAEFNKWTSVEAPPSGEGIYVSQDALSNTTSSDITIGNWDIGSKKLVLLHRGNITIEGNIAVDSASGGAFMLVTSGDIRVKPNVTNVDGLFVAETITTEVANPAKTMGDGEDIQLVVNGSFIGWTEVDLNRDLGCSNPAGNNTFMPAEKFIYNPKMVLNLRTMPELAVLQESKYSWEEVNP